MSLFNKIFKKKGQEETVNNPSHQQEWDFYFSNVNNIIGSFYLDLGLFKITPINNKPNLLWVSLQMNNYRQDGLSSAEEFETLKQIEDRLENLVLSKHNAIYAGRLTTNGKRDFYFYVGDTILLDKTISESMVAFPNYEYEFGVKTEDKWEHYLDFMFPNKAQYQSILNRRVINNLEERGDLLTKERAVDHWIFFKLETDKKTFLSAIKDEGFSIVDNDYNESSGETPYRLRISRIDKVDYNSVDDYVLHIWEIAKQCNGEYDGWETSVEKD